jgi:hypothetical protein
MYFLNFYLARWKRNLKNLTALKTVRFAYAEVTQMIIWT